jgi:V8-like Glu-specific endopeptidase
MSELKTYYTLRYEHADALHRAGDRLFNAADVLHIGQTDYCEARLVNETPFEDAVLAVIRPQEGAEGWVLVPVSPYKEHEVRVGGTLVDCLHLLRDGDRISFAGSRQELLFNIHHDSDYLAKGITPVKVTGMSRWTKVMMVALPLLLALLGWAYLDRRNALKEGLTTAMREEAELSVFQLKVDTIKLVYIERGDTTVLESCADIQSAGTIFLTTDNRLITARHCLEPWLNREPALNSDTSKIEVPYVRWALRAETYNQTMDDGTEMQVITCCSVNEGGKRGGFLCHVNSTQFHFDRSRDVLQVLGTFEEEYCWRSISPRYNNSRMMLGDIAYMEVPEGLLESHPQGTIRLASDQQLTRLLGKKERALTVLGFPAKTTQTNIEMRQGSLSQPFEFDAEGRAVSVIDYTGEVVEGFSGGPVLVRDWLHGFYVVGVVSGFDAINGSNHYAVPVSEIQKEASR